MEASDKRKQEKKKVNKIKIFPVPFAIEEIEKSISFSNNEEHKPSKEQILNQAFKFHSQGNIQEAAKYYQLLINQGFEDQRVFCNFGVILKNLGKLQEAEFYNRKAIKLNPNFVEAHSNLGSILKDLGKLKEAERSYRKAIELNPNFVKAKINLDFITKQQVPLWHIPMMNDDKRNNAYLTAIKSAIKNNEYVLEIGTGSGLLSMMAIDAGAKKVITCEVSEPIAEAAKKIIKKNGYSNRIEVINKKSTELNINADLEKKPDLIISEILSSEFVGEGVQRSLSDANQRLIKENGRMIPEAGEIKVALLESSPEIEKEMFVERVNGYDLSEFNNIIGKRLNVQYLGRKTTTSFLSETKVPFSFDLYSKEIIKRKEIILEIKACKSGICLGLISWLKLKLYENIEFENNPSENCTSGWVNPIYKLNQPLKIIKGQLIKVKATLLDDSVWYEFI